MIDPLPDARLFRFQDISEGTKESRVYVISAEVCDHFLAAFDDRSPIHVQKEYARARGYQDVVVHGSVLNGFLSHFVGMYFPGRYSLLLAVDIRFAKPCYPGDTIRLEAEVSQKLETQQVVVLDMTFQNITQNRLVARGRVQVMLRGEL